MMPAAQLQPLGSQKVPLSPTLVKGGVGGVHVPSGQTRSLVCVMEPLKPWPQLGVTVDVVGVQVQTPDVPLETQVLVEQMKL